MLFLCQARREAFTFVGEENQSRMIRTSSFSPGHATLAREEDDSLLPTPTF
jgi:hypothetical protein